MSRTVNRRTLEMMKEFEGLRLTAYPDPGSKDGHPWTIGYGHTSLAGPPPVHPGMRITKAQASRIYKRDLEHFAAGVEKRIKIPLNDNQFGALVSLAYNIGLGAFERSSVLRAVNAGQFGVVPALMNMWRKNDGKVMRGLVRRRAIEGALFMTPVANRPDPVPSPRTNTDIEVDTGKPAAKSTTIWSAIGGAVMNTVTAVIGLGEKQPILAGLIILVGIGLAVWIIRERRKKALTFGV